MSENPNTPQNASAYIVAVVFMAVLGLLAVVVILVLRPTDDNTVLIATVIGFLGSTTTSLLALIKIQETHLAVNSRMGELLELTKKSSRAEGVIEGEHKGVT